VTTFPTRRGGNTPDGGRRMRMWGGLEEALANDGLLPLAYPAGRRPLLVSSSEHLPCF